MTTRSGVPLPRRRLARRLRQMRISTGMTIEEAAPRLDMKRSALSRIETGQTMAKVYLVQAMMDVYDQYNAELIELARRAMQPGWWVAYGIRDTGFIGVETEACISHTSQIMYVPGLLQTEAYIRAVFGTRKMRRTRQEFENQVAVRLHRQLRLTDESNPLTFTAIIDEAALRRPIGGADVMREQLRHLVEAAELDTLTVQVLPEEVGAHDGMDGAFTILELTDPEEPDLLYVEYPTGAVHVEKDDEVAEARLVLSNLRSVALTPADSVTFIERLGAERFSL